MSVKIEFETDTTVFGTKQTEEISRILWCLTGRVAIGSTKGNIFDADGNMIGKYEIDNHD